MEFHEAANIFPLLEGDEYRKLRDDIKANGLIEPIWTYEGKILDGRNRYIACLDCGVTPKYRQYEGDDPISFVISLNLHRRHLTSSQLGFVALEVEKQLAVEARKRQLSGKKLDHDQIIDQGGRNAQASEQAARMVGTNRQYVSDAKRIEQGAPDLIDKVRSGEMTIPKAVQTMRKREVIANLEDVEQKEVKAIKGVYDVIVIDPPWPMEKIERDVAPNQVAFEYPTMTEEELELLEIPTADSCHVWLWTTHKYLPMALRLLDVWGLKYVCTFTWHKPGGFQPFGLPQYNCEFALYARKGSPIFTETKDFPVCFNAPRGAHSEKPEAFYETIRRVTAGRRLDMFNRRSIDGFDTWGKEAA